MRKLIAGMKLSLDGMATGPEDMADWVDAWSEDYGLTGEIDACLLGAGMFPGYEAYWTAVRADPATPHWIRETPPTKAELAWANLAPRMPHYVLSNRVNETRWPNVAFLRSLADVEALKRQPGKSIYLVGGARLTAGLIEAGLVDQIRLILHPLIAGEGQRLFAESARRTLRLLDSRAIDGSRVMLSYATR